MVTDRKKDSCKTPGKQGPQDSEPEPNKINASTPYDFTGKNLTPYGGLLPVITMLEKLGFQSLVEEIVTIPEKNRRIALLRPERLVLLCYKEPPRSSTQRLDAAMPLFTTTLGSVRKLAWGSQSWLRPPSNPMRLSSH